MRIVLDTAILVRANTKATGPAHLLLQRIAAGGHQLILSPFLLEETARVLNYPRIQTVYGLSPAEIRVYGVEAPGNVAIAAAGLTFWIKSNKKKITVRWERVIQAAPLGLNRCS